MMINFLSTPTSAHAAPVVESSVWAKALIILLASGLSACAALFGEEGYFRDRGGDYMKADSMPPVKVPEGLHQGPAEQLYVIPSISNDDYEYPESFEVPRPQPLASNQFEEKVKIQRLGEKRWILINTPPSEAWPRIRNFLSRNGLQVVFTDATNGIIETGWLQFKTDLEKKDRYRLQIEQGVQPDSTEIHVLQMSVQKDIARGGDVKWPGRSTDREHEAWMVDELAAALVSDVSSGATSLLAQTIGGGAKVEITSSNAEPVLQIGLDYSRAWATLGYALQRDGFSLWEEQRDLGVYYVDFSAPAEEDEEPGFLSRWFGGGDEKTAKVNAYSLQQVLAHLPLTDTPENRRLFANIVDLTGKPPLPDLTGHLVFIRKLDGKIEVRIRDAYASALNNKQAKKLLKVIRRNLI